MSLTKTDMEEGVDDDNDGGGAVYDSQRHGGGDGGGVEVNPFTAIISLKKDNKSAKIKPLGLFVFIFCTGT